MLSLATLLRQARYRQKTMGAPRAGLEVRQTRSHVSVWRQAQGVRWLLPAIKCICTRTAVILRPAFRTGDALTQAFSHAGGCDDAANPDRLQRIRSAGAP